MGRGGRRAGRRGGPVGWRAEVEVALFSWVGVEARGRDGLERVGRGQGCGRYGDVGGRSHVVIVRAEGCDDLVARSAVDCADGDGLCRAAVAALAPSDGPCRDRPAAGLRAGGLPVQGSLDGGLEDGQHAEGEIELAAVFARDVFGVDVLLEGGLHVGGGEDEDFRDGDGVEPALDPAPYGREEGRGADYLAAQSVMLNTQQGGVRRPYEDPVKRFRVVSGSQLARILHVSLQVPKLLQPDIRDVDDVVALGHRCFGIRPVLYHGAER